ncbi:ATP-grasp domain-containing protein [Paracoccus tibetensis]|nr:ATP-grasp domain-containing protein [Paracoccus tibetensis]
MTYAPPTHATPAPDPMPLCPPPGPRYPAFKRRVPERLFYLVPALMWLALSLRHGSLTLPTAANPSMEAGGLWGESKSQGLDLFGPRGRRRIARFARVTCGSDPEATTRAALAALSAEALSFPVVAKPDRGYQGWGVRLIRNEAELSDYLRLQPEGTLVLLQVLIEMQGEAGIFYIREPGQTRGRIVSMALVFAPHVMGDGRRSVEQLVAADSILAPNAPIYRQRHPEDWDRVLPEGAYHRLTNARSARLGAVYLDALDQVTPALTRAIDEISREIPDFHFGRFDIRFESLTSLREGRAFCIVELNGAGAEMLHIWAGTGRLWDAWRTLWRQYRTLFAIGAEMRRRGHRPVGLRGMIRLQRRQEALRRIYPPSS